MPIDRRSGEERRAIPRRRVSIDIEWQSGDDRRNGTISDVSRMGCFVLTGGEFREGQKVRLFLPIGDGMRAEYSGEVVNHVFEIGFAVKFDPLTEAQSRLLDTLIGSAEK